MIISFGSSVLNRRALPGTHHLLVVILIAGILSLAGISAFAEQDTFTKWITTAPAMAGIVGGEDGEGSYAGEILKYTEGDTTVIEALYHFNGALHSFSALVHVEQTGLNATVSGVVTEGWNKGSLVKGSYTQISSDKSPNGTAFQGTLDIMPGN
jgi:hypothetical protein